jgi:hypothetical protein
MIVGSQDDRAEQTGRLQRVARLKGFQVAQVILFHPDRAESAGRIPFIQRK